MHIEKIFFDDLFNTIINVARKTQDNEFTFSLFTQILGDERLKIQMQDTL